MKREELLARYADDDRLARLTRHLETPGVRLQLKGLTGSFAGVIAAASFLANPRDMIVVLPDKEKAAYFHNDLETLLGQPKNLLFFPESFRVAYAFESSDNANIAMRAEVLNAISHSRKPQLVVSYPEALAEKVVDQKNTQNQQLPN
jgi:transcription-repair coupling factor (superfamily II helicase)